MQKQNKITAVIVDDELLAREDLKRLLSKFSDIEIAGEASSLTEAIDVCTKSEPGIVFLDVQLTNDSGFELIDHLGPNTKVVFVTAFDEYAIKAFEVNAYDYLLKPVSLDRLEQTIEKFKNSESQKLIQNQPLNIDDSIFLKLDSKYRFVKISGIKFISSADDYSEIKIDTENKTRLINKSLREWEDRLPASHFCRIHRFTIINIDFIENIEPWHNYSHRIYIKGEQKPLLMSRRYFSIIKNKLG